MSEIIKMATASKLLYALQYARIGWHVFPIWGAKQNADGIWKCACGAQACNSPGKHPVSGLVPRGQNDSTINEAKIKEWWTAMPEAGVAVHLAPSNLMALDIDPRNGGLYSLELLEAKHGPLNSDVTAFTQGGGEHRVFSHPAQNRLPGKLGPGLDVKLNGYICVEPTKGVLGSYAWEGSSNPLEGAIPSPLPDWLRDLISSPAPSAQGIETIVSRFATNEQKKELEDALSHVPSNDRSIWVRFGMALAPLGQEGYALWTAWSQKSNKYDPVDQIRTWRSFFKTKSAATVINFESIFWEAQQNGWQNPLAGAGEALPVIKHDEPVRKIKTLAAAPEPTESDTQKKSGSGIRLPGILGDVQDWVNAGARKPQPEFAIQIALAFGATIAGRKYISNHSNWTAMFFVNMGASGCGKEHAKWSLEKLLHACEMGHLIGPSGYSSDTGVLSSLLDAPNHLTVMDEFGRYLKTAGQSSASMNGRAYGVLTTLMEMWGRANGQAKIQGRSKLALTTIDKKNLAESFVMNPSIILMAMSTPDVFYEAAGMEAVRDGFLNRFMIVETDIGPQKSQKTADMPIPQKIIDWAKRTRTYSGPVNPDLTPTLYPNPTIFEFTDEAENVLSDFEDWCLAKITEHKNTNLSEMFIRTQEIAMRISLILAVSCEESEITADHAKIAIRYVRHHTERLVAKLLYSVADSEFRLGANDVLRLITKAGKEGITKAVLLSQSRKFKALDHRGQETILKTLNSEGSIEIHEFPRASGRGKKRIAYMACNPEDDD